MPRTGIFQSGEYAGRMREILSATLFGIFLFVTIFGLPVLLSHSDHHMGCPLQAAATVMCESTVIDHVSMWQAMFASVIGTLILALGFAAIVIGRQGDLFLAHERLRVRSRSLASVRPLLFQELYSRGIHNRKEPSRF